MSGPGLGRRRARRGPRACILGCRPSSPRRSACSTARRSPPAEDPHRLTVAAGPRDGSGGMKAVNLIPTDQRRAKASGAQAGGGYVVLGVLGRRCSLMAVAYVITANSVNRQHDEGRQGEAPGGRPRGAGLAAGRLHRLRHDQAAAARRRQDGRRDALRLGAPDARALARHARGQLAPDDRRVDRGGHRRLVRSAGRPRPPRPSTRTPPSRRTPTSSAARRTRPRSRRSWSGSRRCTASRTWS